MIPVSLWRQFPVFYVLPFLLSTIEIESVAGFNESLRWLMMGVGVFVFITLRAPFGIRQSGNLLKTDVVIIGFLVLFAGSYFWSIEPSYSLQRSLSMVLLYICSFWTFWYYADRFSEEMLVRKMILVVTAVLMLNILLIPFLPGVLTRGRFSGVFVNPNNIGMIAGLCAPLAFSLWLKNRQRLYLLAFLVPLTSLAAAGTRSALLGVFVAMSLILASIFRRHPARSFMIALLAITAVVTFSQTDYFIEHVLREESLQTGSNRVLFWELAKEYISKRPQIGHGFGTDALIHQYYGLHLSAVGLRGYGVMSSYFGLAVQLGWVATVIFFLFLWLLALRCVLAFRRDPQLVALGATLISGLVICIFEPAIYSAGNAFAFLFWICVMLAIRRLHYRRRKIPLDFQGGLSSLQTRNPVRSTVGKTG